MSPDQNKIFTESIKRLLRRNAATHLRKIVNKAHAADLSVAFRSLSLSEQRRLFNLIDDTEKKGILFSELDEDTFQAFIEGMNIDHVVEILEKMPTDDVADLIGRLPEETPKLAVTLSRPSLVTKPCLSIPSRSFWARDRAPSASVSGNRAMNSSPPYLATISPDRM